MIKKTVAVVLVVLTIFFSMNTVFAVDTYEGYNLPVDVDINGNFIKCSQKPIVINGTTFIPLRAFADAIGGTVLWDEATMAATLVKDNHSLVFYTDRSCSIIDGVEKDYTSILYNDLTYIPVRVISEALGYGVSWDEFYMTVKIVAPQVVVPEACIDRTYTYEDILYLSKITYTESGAEPFVVQLGIAGTVFNRVKSPLFPNTVKEVIFDKKYGVQFPPAHTNLINRTPAPKSIIAAKCVLWGVNVIRNSLYFTGASYASSSWAHKNRPYYTTLGKVAFYE